MTDTLTLSLFPLLMALAGIGDYLTMRIPNWLVLTIAAAAVVMAAVLGMPAAVALWHLAAAGLTFAIGFALFAFNRIGGGDAKLLTAAALWVGWSGLVPFAVYTAMAGGVLALVMIVWSTIAMEQELRGPGWAKRLFRNLPDMPYGIAIAAGAILAFPETWWMRALAGA